MQAELAYVALAYLKIELVRADFDLKLVDWTDGAARFVSQPLQMGLALTQVFPALADIQPQLDALLLAASDSLDLHKVSQTQADGMILYYGLSVLRIFDDVSNQPQLLCVLRDITAEAELEQKLSQQFHELKVLRQQLQNQLAGN